MIAGSGFFGVAIVQKLNESGKSVMVIERRSQIWKDVFTRKKKKIKKKKDMGLVKKKTEQK